MHPHYWRYQFLQKITDNHSTVERNVILTKKNYCKGYKPDEKLLNVSVGLIVLSKGPRRLKSSDGVLSQQENAMAPTKCKHLAVIKSCFSDNKTCRMGTRVCFNETQSNRLVSDVWYNAMIIFCNVIKVIVCGEIFISFHDNHTVSQEIHQFKFSNMEFRKYFYTSNKKSKITDSLLFKAAIVHVILMF